MLIRGKCKFFLNNRKICLDLDCSCHTPPEMLTGLNKCVNLTASLTLNTKMQGVSLVLHEN